LLRLSFHRSFGLPGPLTGEGAVLRLSFHHFFGLVGFVLVKELCCELLSIVSLVYLI
jgi:hypothetical protein